MRVLCVGRHQYIAEHLGRFFAQLGLETSWAVGVHDAVRSAWSVRPNALICDYDLLTSQSLIEWERDAILSRTPVIGVSLTRRPDEVNPLDVNGIGGFIYLPQLTADGARELFGGVCAPEQYSPVGAGAGRTAMLNHWSRD